MSDTFKNTKVWYLPSNFSESPEGPFSFYEIKELIQKGELRLDQYIWGSHLPSKNWYRMMDIDEFKPLLVQYPNRPLPKQFSTGKKNRSSLPERFFRRSGEYGQENLYRRYPRVAVSAEAIIHNNNRICRGRCVDFSEMGMFVLVDNLNFFDKGEEVTITLREVPSIETFSVNAVIIRIVNEPESSGYALNFLRIQPKTRRLLAKYILTELEIEDQSFQKVEQSS